MQRMYVTGLLALSLALTGTVSASAADTPASARQAVQSAVEATVARLSEGPIALEVVNPTGRVFALQRDEENNASKFSDGVQVYQLGYLGYVPYRADAVSTIWADTLAMLGISGPFNWIADERDDVVAADAAVAAFTTFYAGANVHVAKATTVVVTRADQVVRYVFTQPVTAAGPKVKGKATKIRGNVTTSIALSNGTVTSIAIKSTPALAKLYPTRSLTITDQTTPVAVPQGTVLDLHQLDTDPDVVKAMTKVRMLDAARRIIARAQTYAKSTNRPVGAADLQQAMGVEDSDFAAFSRTVGDALQIIANPGGDAQIVLCAVPTNDGAPKADWDYCPE